MNKNQFIYISLIICNIYVSFGQTVGIINNTAQAYNGYTLLAPVRSTETYLINNCGQVINQWSSSYTAGASAYLLENGNLLRTGKINNADFTFGGVGGIIELYDWEGNLVWEYTHSTSTYTLHHDIYPLSNGNILAIVATEMSQTEAIQAGRNPTNIVEGKVFNEQIIEIEPIGTNQANIVWEWNIKDHLIQDFDNTKDNYGIVGDNPELLDFNYLHGLAGNANWLHMNSIQYNESLNQILISTRHLSEIYIIDHSTTTTQAASHSGGIYGKGGDILYRWGNKEAYDKGTNSDQTLDAQHYPHWIPDGLNDAGKIMIFNNGPTTLISSIEIINPTTSSPGFYNYDTTNGYLPSSAEWQYIDPNNPTDFFSAILSSGQRLPNGNTLICDGDSGYFFEIDTNNNKVWEYINPVATSEIISQGNTPAPGDNIVFRAIKFATDYPAFTGRDMTPGDPIELNFDISGCQILTVDEYSINNFVSIYPNPSSDIISLKSALTIDKIEIFNLFGKKIKSEKYNEFIDIQNLSSGLYLLKVYSNNKFGVKKFIKV